MSLTVAQKCPGEVLLRAKSVSVRYGEHLALEEVSLDIFRGEILSLVGPNGAGKSTLIKALAGLLPLASGSVDWLHGTPRLGYVPQQPPAENRPPLTVGELLGLRANSGRWWFGGGSRQQSDNVENALVEAGAVHLRARKLGALSGGETARVMMAFALLGNPEVLFLDEPLTGVDARGGTEFEGLIRDLNDRRRMTVVMVSHDLHLVSHLSHRVGCINRGLHCVGDAAEVLQEHVLSGLYGLPDILNKRRESPHVHGPGCCAKGGG